MEKIKVLVVTATMNAGGLENQLMHLLRNADKEIEEAVTRIQEKLNVVNKEYLNWPLIK